MHPVILRPREIDSDELKVRGPKDPLLLSEIVGIAGKKQGVLRPFIWLTN